MPDDISDPDPIVDDVLATLANRRRRIILRLLAVDSPRTLTDLAGQIVAIENDIEVSTVNADERKSVYITLLQGHADELANSNAVEYDEQAKQIDKGPEFACMMAVLRCIDDQFC